MIFFVVINMYVVDVHVEKKFFEIIYFILFWLNGDVNLEKNWVKQLVYRKWKCDVPQLGRTPDREAVCYVGTTVWLSPNLGSLAFDPKQSQTCQTTLSLKLFILLQRQQVRMYWQWQDNLLVKLTVLQDVHMVTY